MRSVRSSVRARMLIRPPSGSGPTPWMMEFSTRVARTGEPLAVHAPLPESFRSTIRPAILEIIDRLKFRSIACVALRVRGTILGTLALVRYGEGAHPLDHHDQDLLQVLADHAAMTISNARLLASVKRELEEHKRTREALERTEEKLRQSQKMEAVGRLAGGVAHDFNNVLSVVLGYADLLLDEEPLPETARAKVEGILKAARHGAALTGQLLAFGRQQVLEPRVADLNEIVRSMVGMLQSSLDSRVKVALDLATDLHPVKVDPAKIGQVVMNLLINARDSMPNGGHVTIRTGNEAPPDSSGATPKRPHAMIAHGRGRSIAIRFRATCGRRAPSADWRLRGPRCPPGSSGSRSRGRRAARRCPPHRCYCVWRSRRLRR